VRDLSGRAARAIHLLDEGTGLYEQGDHRRSDLALRQASAILRELTALDPTYEAALARSLRARAESLAALGRPRQAAASAAESAALFRKLARTNASRHELEFGRALLTLARVLSGLDMHEAALPRAAEAVVVFDRRAGDDASALPHRRDAVRAMVAALDALGRQQEAAGLRAQLDEEP
jgi:hypothetical protein